MKTIKPLFTIVTLSLLIMACQPGTYGSSSRLGSKIHHNSSKKRIKKGHKYWQKSRVKRKKAHGRPCPGLGG